MWSECRWYWRNLLLDALALRTRLFPPMSRYGIGDVVRVRFTIGDPKGDKCEQILRCRIMGVGYAFGAVVYEVFAIDAGTWVPFGHKCHVFPESIIT